MYNFCTLFDHSYLSRGLALYRSLERNDTDFHMYILAFDVDCLHILHRLKLEKATVVALKDFESEELLEVKSKRTLGEYCWTCASSWLYYCLIKYKLPSCTYLDADLYFFSSPKVLFDEIGENPICITEHRYSPQYNKALKAGKYCVQFVYIQNTSQGIYCLNWWREQCLNWCYNRFEDGKFGDQKYLDYFTEKFQQVHELQHLGGGVAPWNIQQYDIFKNQEHLFAKDKRNNSIFEVIFYHYHYFRFLKNGYVDCGRYNLTQNEIELIYKPYLKSLQNAAAEIAQIVPDFNPHGQAKLSAWKRWTRFLAMYLRWDANIYKIKKLG